VHHSQIAEGDSLREGDQVEFEIVQEEKGPAAREVTKVDSGGE
jgi:cold shock CspA family protein